MSTDSKETGKTEEHADHHEMGFWGKYVFSRDHKAIGMQFMMTALFMLFIGGGLAVTLRMRLAWPDADFMGIDLSQFGGETYNVLFSMHATVMIFFVIIPFLVGAFGNFVVPLHIGARDMAFPFLNGLSYWIMPLAGIVMFGGIVLEGVDSGLKNGAFASGGWTSYPPLSQIAGYGQDIGAIREFLTRKGSQCTIVPYCENRAIIFDSNLFHESDTVDFKSGYENHRINITLLFGQQSR